MFPRWHLCFDVYFGVKRHTVWGKTKTCLGWFRLCMCVYGLEMYLYVSICVWWGAWDYMCTYHSVCMRVFAAVSGDICCVVGWELSAVGCESLRLRRWKPRSQPGLVGQDTLALTTHRYKVTHANIKRYTQTACTRCTHTASICLSRTQNAEGIQKHKDKRLKKNRVKINQLSRQNNI